MSSDCVHRLVRRIPILLIGLLSLMLNGCWGDGSSNTPGGNALKGPLSGATVQIFALSDQVNPIVTVVTDGTGAFKLTTALPNPTNYYLIKVSGGNDLDANDDGIADAAPTPNQGTLLGVALGSDINAGHVNVTVLSDMVWRFLGMGIGGGSDVDSASVSAELERVAALILQPGSAGDINGDGSTDYRDILAFVPSNTAHLAKLTIDYSLVHQPVDPTAPTPMTLADDYHSGSSTLTSDLRTVFYQLASQAQPQFAYPATAKTVKVSVTVIGGGTVTGPDLPAAVTNNGRTTIVLLPRSETAYSQLTATVTNTAYRFNSWIGCAQANGNTCLVGLDKAASVVARFEQITPVLADGITGVSNVELYQGISDVTFNGSEVTFVTQLEATQNQLNAADTGTVLQTPVKAHALIKIQDVVSRNTSGGTLTAVFDYVDVGPLDVYKSFSAIDNGQPLSLNDVTGVALADGLTDSDGTPVIAPTANDPNSYPSLPAPCDPQTDPNCSPPPPVQQQQSQVSMQTSARNSALMHTNLKRSANKRQAKRVWIAGVGNAYDVGRGIYLAEAAPGQRGLRLLRIPSVRKASSAEALRLARRDCNLRGHTPSCSLVAESDRQQAGLHAAANELPLLQKPVSKSFSKNFGPGNALVAKTTISLGLNLSLTPQGSFDYTLVPLYASATVGADLTMDPALGLTLSVGTVANPSPSSPSTSDQQRYTQKYSKPQPANSQNTANIEYTVISISASQFMGALGAVLEADFDLDVGVDMSGNITLNVTPGFHAEANGSVNINAGCSVSNGCSAGASANGTSSAYPLVTATLTGTAEIQPFVELDFNVGIQKILPQTGKIFIKPYVDAEGSAQAGFQYGPMTRPGTRLYNSGTVNTNLAIVQQAANYANSLTPRPSFPALDTSGITAIFFYLGNFDGSGLGSSTTDPDVIGFRTNSARATALNNLLAAEIQLQDDPVRTETSSLSLTDVSRLKNEAQAITNAVNQVNSLASSASGITVNIQVPIGNTFCLDNPKIAVGVNWGLTAGLVLSSDNWIFPLNQFKLDQQYDFYNQQWNLFSYPNAAMSVPTLPAGLACPSS